MALLAEVESYLRKAGTTATRFGREVAGDPCLVADMRRGRVPRRALAFRILSRIGDPGRPAMFVAALAGLAQARGLRPPGAVDARSWACGSFSGDQVRCLLPCEPARIVGWAARLPDREWDLPFLVADLAADLVADGVEITAVLLPSD